MAAMAQIEQVAESIIARLIAENEELRRRIEYLKIKLNEDAGKEAKK